MHGKSVEKYEFDMKVKRLKSRIITNRLLYAVWKIFWESCISCCIPIEYSYCWARRIRNLAHALSIGSLMKKIKVESITRSRHYFLLMKIVTRRHD